MFLDGEIVEVGVGEWNDGVAIQIDEAGKDAARTIAITGLSQEQVRAFGRMLYERVTIKIESKDELARCSDQQPAPTPQSNIDEATGIAKTGEI